MKRTRTCPTCGHTSDEERCDGCGTDVAGRDDAYAIAVGLMQRATPDAYLFYCYDCAPKYLNPYLLGRGPGSDLPASYDPPPEQPS